MIVHVVPEHENAGKIVLAPIVFPCVLEPAESEIKSTGTQMVSSYVLTPNEGNSHGCRRSLEELYICDRNDLIISPIAIREVIRWLGESLAEVRRNINLINMQIKREHEQERFAFTSIRNSSGYSTVPLA